MVRYKYILEYVYAHIYTSESMYYILETNVIL